ncbi:hypothetical protein SAMN04487765_1565 [Tenacibaculum sp. MAR_2010_89]|uniref:hypothetical protein n=1 Tax=Tenacibaculum sp. MAR_2010_89 TaxID=1250198 RepID=UPI00089D29A9|nr:hypothetical protein [Tenacibaculum sp. MAR_2010_89]SEE14962.1 hypothetical protein SAMN04487765_1565 [Tenacibaculum sp. MAR_2010_89]
MKKFLFTITFILAVNLVAQNTINQNGLQSTVTNPFSADAAQPKRYKIATVLYNSQHWQNSSIIQVELFNILSASGYEKYIIELGNGQGTGATLPKTILVESKGIQRHTRLILGSSVNHTTTYAGYINKTIDIYVDVKYYSIYQAKITHLRNKVDSFTAQGQIIINEIPTGVNTADFQPPVVENTNISNVWEKNGNDITYDNGNVGIGISSLTTEFKLDVNGFVKLDALASPHTNLRIGHDINDRIFADNSSNKLYGGGLFFRVTPDASVYAPFNYIDLMALTDKGTVGIGTTDTKGFKLGVNGKIAATEVKIATYTNWSDFVFAKDYNLPTLTEVENHIKTKGHLQNIPSATEVKKHGFFLGEMDAKLLQKIEELTLYTIQQEKKLDKQAKEIETLKLLVKQVLEKKE